MKKNLNFAITFIIDYRYHNTVLLFLSLETTRSTITRPIQSDATLTMIPLSPSSPTTGYTPAPSTPTQNDGVDRAMFESRSMNRTMMLWVLVISSIAVLLRSYGYAYRDPDVTQITARVSSKVALANGTQSISPADESLSWMDKIASYRSRLADVSHELKHRKKNQKAKTKDDTTVTKNAMTYDNNNGKNRKTSNHDFDNGRMEDLTILHDAVVDIVRDVGVRGLLFEILSDDFEYYVYVDDDHQTSSDSADEIDKYWEKCASKHGVGEGCNEWDVWWTYHYIGAIVTDMLLLEQELLWDGSSGERIITASTDTEAMDTSMAILLGKIQHLQATLPYLTQASFHTEHALIWRYVEKSSGRLSSTYPWELAFKFCRGDGSRTKGIVGRPVGKGVDHECFHGFGHAMFYAVASKQLQKLQEDHTDIELHGSEQEKQPFLVLAPHSGFSLSPESYCDVYELCRGASLSKEKRLVMDPNNEASGNSYRICFEGVVHSVRLLSSDTNTMIHKESALDFVEKEMKRCASARKKKTKRMSAKEKGSCV